MSTPMRCLAGCVLLGFVVAASPGALAQDAPDPDTPVIDLNAPAPTPEPDTPPTAETTESASGVTSPTEVTADEVLREFQRDRPRAEPLRPQPPGMAPQADTPVGDSRASSGLRRLPDGSMLVDRAGRLVRDGVWWTITFVSDNNPDQAPDPPMKLLPNQMLERAVRETQDGTRSVEFIVSGEVTDFMGENFLLLRKLMRKRELGNLSS